MLDKKQIQVIFLYLSSKWTAKTTVKQQRQLTTSIAQEFLTNVQFNDGSRSYAKERRALKMRVAVAGIRGWQWPMRAIVKADPLRTVWEVAQELNVNHSMVIQHLKQIGKVKKLNKWVPHELTANQNLSFWNAVFHATMRTISGLDCDMWLKSGFYMTTISGQLSGWTEKTLQTSSQSWTQSKNRSWSLFSVCCQSDPLQLSESQRNHNIWEVCSANQWDALKTAMPAANIGQQKEPSSPQHLNAHCTISASKVGQIGLKSSALSAMFTWPLLPDYHFFKHFNNFLRVICFYNQQEAENAFQEFVEYWSMDFYATGLSKLISCWQKCIDCNGSHFG